MAPPPLIGALMLRVPQGSCARRPKKIQSFSRPFPSIIQGLPVDYFITYNPTGTREKHTDLKHSCMTFINNKRSTQLFYPLNSNYKSCWKFHIGKFQTFQDLPLVFQNNSRTFSVLWNIRTFQGWPWIQGRCRNPGSCRSVKSTSSA